MQPYLVRWHRFEGYKTRYLTAGDGLPIILLHGGGPGSSVEANWRVNVPALATKYSVYAPEYLGFGLSDKPKEEHFYQLSYRAKQILEFMDSFCIDKAYLVGNSYGGTIAYYMAWRYPERIFKMVVQGAPIDTFESPGFHTIVTYTPTLENQRKMCEHLVYNTKLITEELVKERLKFTQMPGAMEAIKISVGSGMLHMRPYLEEIKVPTYVIHGRHDSTVPVDHGTDAAKKIKRAKLKIFEDAGHSVQLEKADEFNKLVMDFFAE
jgi:2-hydroxymuconate-semialdehyde hydrolase